MSRKAEIFAALEDLLDQVRGYLRGEGGQGAFQIVVRVAVVAEDAGDVVDELGQWWVGREMRSAGRRSEDTEGPVAQSVEERVQSS